MKATLLLLWILAGGACGAVEKRILGGQSCKERRYHVQIETTVDKRRCGGSLLSPGWVITAAHCAKQALKLKMDKNNDLSFFKNIKMKIKSTFKSTNYQLEQDIPVNQQFTSSDEGGLALIKLNQVVKVPAIEIPAAGENCKKPEAGSKVQVGGWGIKTTDEMNPKIPKNLKCANTHITACESEDEAIMCASYVGVSACNGDTGSAVVHNGLLHGIILNKPGDECESQLRIANICHYRQWIDDTTSKKTTSQSGAENTES